MHRLSSPLMHHVKADHRYIPSSQPSCGTNSAALKTKNLGNRTHDSFSTHIKLTGRSRSLSFCEVNSVQNWFLGILEVLVQVKMLDVTVVRCTFGGFWTLHTRTPSGPAMLEMFSLVPTSTSELTVLVLDTRTNTIHPPLQETLESDHQTFSNHLQWVVADWSKFWYQ